MINGFYAAKSGMKNYQYSLDVTGNNIANVNTQGYQAKEVNFTDLIYTSAQGLDVMVGNGSRAQTTTNITNQGAAGQEWPMSAMISGTGYFSVENADGTISFLRSGNFSISQEQGQSYLVVKSGEYVLNQQGQRIAANLNDFEGALAQVALYSFLNPGALDAQGDGKYAVSAASGEAAVDNVSQWVTGATELSNVDLIGEMTRMMIAQRGFQFNAKMIQTADELEQITNGLRT